MSREWTGDKAMYNQLSHHSDSTVQTMVRISMPRYCKINSVKRYQRLNIAAMTSTLCTKLSTTDNYYYEVQHLQYVHSSSLYNHSTKETESIQSQVRSTDFFSKKNEGAQ